MGPVIREYRVVPPWRGLVSSVLFTIGSSRFVYNEEHLVVFVITLSLSNRIKCLTENLFVVKSSENEKIIGQIVRSGK